MPGDEEQDEREGRSPRPADMFSPASPLEDDAPGRTPGRRRTRREKAQDRMQELAEAREDLAVLTAAGMTPEQIAQAAADREIDDMLARGSAPDGFWLLGNPDPWLVQMRRTYMRTWLNAKRVRDAQAMEASIRNFRRYFDDYMRGRQEQRVRELQTTAQPRVNFRMDPDELERLRRDLKGGFWGRAVERGAVWQGTYRVSDGDNVPMVSEFANPSVPQNVSSAGPMSIGQIIANTPPLVIGVTSASELPDEVAGVKRLIEQSRAELAEYERRKAEQEAQRIAQALVEKSAALGPPAEWMTSTGDAIHQLVEGVQRLYGGSKAPTVPPETPEVLPDDDDIPF